MQTDIEKIITELYAIDPVLKEHGDDIRVLVSTLLESKPHVVISENFVLNLRKSLLNRASQGVSTPAPSESISNISSWFFRLAPLPAIAILLLALIPDSANSPAPYLQQSDMYEVSDPTVNTYQMNAPAPDMDTSGASNQMFKSSALSAPESAQIDQVQNPLMLETIELSQPGFAVVQTSTGEIIGMSKLLPAGQTVGVYINLQRLPGAGEEFTTMLYVDNGDRVYGKDDTPLSSI